MEKASYKIFVVCSYFPIKVQVWLGKKIRGIYTKLITCIVSGGGILSDFFLLVYVIKISTLNMYL